MSVDQGALNFLVPQELLHGEEGDPSLNEPRGAGMPQTGRRELAVTLETHLRLALVPVVSEGRGGHGSEGALLVVKPLYARGTGS